MNYKNVDQLIAPKNITINLTYLKEFSQGDLYFEKELLLDSSQDVNEQMLLLESSIAKKELNRIKSIAHSLKSLMSIIGIDILYNQFKMIENLDIGIEEELFVNSTFQYIKQYWEAVKIEIEKIIISHDSAFSIS